MQEGRILLRTARRGEDDGHMTIDKDVHELVYFGIHERNVNAPGLVGGRLELADVLQEGVRMHRTGTQKAQASAVAHGCGQPPATAPHHASGDDGIGDAEQAAYSVA